MAKILLVDDDPAMLSFLGTALENKNHFTQKATNGKEALDILENNSEFDLLLTDVVMPVIDGMELSKTVSDLYPDIKIMFITGFSASLVKPSVNIKGATNVISKPFHLNDLIRRIDIILAS